MNSRDDETEYPLLETQKEEGLINSSTGLVEKDEEGKKKTYPEAIVVAIAVFAAYAAMVVLQHKLADKFFEDTTLTGNALKMERKRLEQRPDVSA